MVSNNPVKKPSHVGAALAIGAILGVAAGFFLQSKKGKELTKQAQKKAVALEVQVMKKLKEVGNLTKEKYGEVVDHVLAYYAKTKELTKKEMPEVKKFLLSRWQAMKKYVQHLK